MSEGSQSMGDIFSQRRAAKKGKISILKNPSSVAIDSTNVGRPPSLADIQAEQEQEKSLSSRMPSNDRRANDRQSSMRSDRNEHLFSSRSSPFRTDDSRSSFGRDTSFRGPDRTENRGSGRRKPDRSNLPLERGCISSLKESFGFIYCADREDELFFHFSEVSGTHTSALKVDDELEFLVGESKNSDKLAAFNVVVLEPGTIVWEIEEEPRVRRHGLVEKPVRSERGSNNVIDGKIRVLVDAETTNEESKVEMSTTEYPTVATGPLVSFTDNDYAIESGANPERSPRRSESLNSQSSRGHSNRLACNDLVEFTMVTSSRNGTNYARDITLLLSERERQRLALEKEMLANATIEQGIVKSLKKDFGFLKSNRRREEIHFHYSNVVLREDGDESDNVLQEGQEMEFLVITESTGKGGREKLSARQIKFLPKGSVIFHKVLATGVTGTVTRVPHATDMNYSSELVGRVKLHLSVTDIDDEGNEKIVSEIDFHPSDSPGGSFSLCEGNSVGLWVHEGDTLLFDVVKDMTDDSYRLNPTNRTSPSSDEENQHSTSAVKLISASLAGRAEGVIHSIKDGFGFILLAERSVDVYFRMYELMPDSMQKDIRANMGLADSDNGIPLKCQVGTEVQFDLSLQGIESRNRGRRGQRIPQHDKENLLAKRIILLPSGTVRESKIIAKDVLGVVVKEDPKQPYAGQIELEKECMTMSPEERHPLLSNLIKSLLSTNESQYPESIVFHGIQATNEDELVTDLVAYYGKGKLYVSHIPVAGERDSAGRICIMRGKDAEDDFKIDETSKDTDVVDGNNVDCTAVSIARSKWKKPFNWGKSTKLIRFDKHCLIEDMRRALPPSVGDVVKCDVVQSRRTGVVSLFDVQVIESSKVQTEELSISCSCVGIVAEVVHARKFGFINVLDENSTKRENIFFHTKSVVTPPERRLSANGTETARSRSPLRPTSILKGDEVEFDIAVGEKGKKVALNVRILPSGTVNFPSKASKDSCHGIVILESSHTTLRNNPKRKGAYQASSTSPVRGAGTSRWDNVDLGERSEKDIVADVKDEGCILLTKDPFNVFSKQTSASAVTMTIVSTEIQTESIDSTKKVQDTQVLEGTLELVENVSAGLCSHLHYKHSAVSGRGIGTGSRPDFSGGPRRGDLVSFVKGKGTSGVRDVRVITKGAATMLRGHLEDISISNGVDSANVGTAKFVASTDQKEYLVDLKELMRCDVSALKVNESVEGILHDGQIFGVCRTSDRYLESKLGSRNNERPKLNLAVRKGLGGTIMAQSGMAKGPNGTNGFVEGWTTRNNVYLSDISELYDTPLTTEG